MKEYLEFKKARCKDCYKCLRECPVKAIEVKEHQARIITERCILCGRCTVVCPQNAKIVHSEKDEVDALLLGNDNVVASVAPSFISSFRLRNFSQMETVLYKLGFAYAEETAVGANAVTKEYEKCIATGNFPNFITSACPALCRLIQEYHPYALKYLAPVDSPMIAHAKMLRKRFPGCRVVFIGPCIAKKREARESGLIDGVLTFEDLRRFMTERGVTFPLPDAQEEFERYSCTGITDGTPANKSKCYPVRRGIIHSFEHRPEGYDYMAVDGPDGCVNALENIEKMTGVFLEMNMCKNACVGGPCSLVEDCEGVRAAVDVKRYVREECEALPREKPGDRPYDVDISAVYPPMESKSLIPTEEQIAEILQRTGKFKPEDELNCGSCGYPTCREKAWAVFNGYADIDICLPYMRERAESMSYEIIHNSPEGIVVLDSEMNVVDINSKAKELLGITAVSLKGLPAIDFFNPTEFLIAQNSGRQYVRKKIYVAETKRHLEISISILKGNHALFGILKDITEEVHYNEKLGKMRMETLATTDEVIKKQMRVAQEIASLLGETTAETKVALLKLKKTLMQEEEERERSEK
ncbi:MAG TPA: PAS domain S-box protein [Candidatus Coprenecus pullistercoris]|nr:PAS domain S-box protein [Candidatus Coprenecus pullistercoris]